MRIHLSTQDEKLAIYYSEGADALFAETFVKTATHSHAGIAEFGQLTATKLLSKPQNRQLHLAQYNIPKWALLSRQCTRQAAKTL